MGDDDKCSADVGEGTYFMAGVVAINAIMATVHLLSGLFHSVLRRLGQPSIISHILAGVVVGPTVLGRAVDLRWLGMQDAGSALGDTIYYIRIVFMFFIGLEMDLRYLRHNLRRSLVLACGGSAISLLLAAVAGPFFYGLLHPGQGAFHPAKLYAYTALFMLGLASTASPVLIRIVTELKLTASETGQLAIGAAFATDIACLTTISMMVVNPTTFAKDGTPNPPRVPGASAPEVQLIVFLWMALVVWVAVAVAVRAARLLNRVKLGRRYISKYELCAMLVLIVGISLLVQYLGYSASMTAFLVGLAMPRDGPMARTLIDRLTYPVHQIVMPLCFRAIGARLDFADVGRFTATQLTAAIVFTTVLSVAGKVAGTVLAGRWLGFLLNVKGYSDILAINFGDKSGVWGDTAQVVLLVSSILNTFMAGPAAAIVRQQRRAFQYRSHCLQDLRVDHELRVLVCVHGAGGVNAMLTVAELSKGSGAPVAVYLLHLVELMAARKYAITHLYKDVDARLKLRSRGNVDDEDQWGYAREMDQVAAAVHGFTIYDAAVPVRQMTAISNLASMDGDVRNGVEDARASLVIVPYHKEQRYDGRMVSRRDGRRQLNQRILQRAPCTVGVLVERHLPSISVAEPVSARADADRDGGDEEEQSAAGTSPLAAAEEQESAAAVHHVVAVFLGGSDDREAVAYATRLSAHPSVSVSVSRFRLAQPAPPDDNIEKVQTDEEQEEQVEDEEFMAEVYAGFVAPGGVSYTETYVSNGVETLQALSGMVGMCSLFMVGRGGGAAWAAMTRGMGGLDEEECPELGRVGELLASDDFLGCSSSVLVLQQHKLHQKMRTWKKLRHSRHGPMPDHHPQLIHSDVEEAEADVLYM